MMRFKKGDLAIIVLDSDAILNATRPIEGSVVEIISAWSYPGFRNNRMYDYRVSPPNDDWGDCLCMDYELRPIGGIGERETDVEVKIEAMEETA